MGPHKRVCEDTVSDLAEMLNELKGVDLGPEPLKGRLRSLFERRAQAIPLLLRQCESEDEETLAFAAAALRAIGDPSIVPALLELLRSPHIGDLAKGLLLNLLEHYGLDTQDASLIGASIDLREALKGWGAEQGTE